MRRSNAAYWALMGTTPVLAVAAFAAIGGLAGMAAGLGVFLLGTGLANAIWRRNATPEDIRREIEDRLRNPP